MPSLMIALILLANITECINSASFIKFVDGDDIRKVKHVNLFQLTRCAKLRCHDIQRNVRMISDLCIRLPNATRLEDYHVESCGLQDIQCVFNLLRKSKIGLSGRHGTHVNIGFVDCIHSNSVTKQCATCFSFTWIYRNNSQCFSFVFHEESANEFVDET